MCVSLKPKVRLRHPQTAASRNAPDRPRSSLRSHRAAPLLSPLLSQSHWHASVRHSAARCGAGSSPCSCSAASSGRPHQCSNRVIRTACEKDWAGLRDCAGCIDIRALDDTRLPAQHLATHHRAGYSVRITRESLLLLKREARLRRQLRQAVKVMLPPEHTSCSCSTPRFNAIPSHF